jgi:hypothetical protein
MVPTNDLDNRNQPAVPAVWCLRERERMPRRCCGAARPTTHNPTLPSAPPSSSPSPSAACGEWRVASRAHCPALPAWRAEGRVDSRAEWSACNSAASAEPSASASALVCQPLSRAPLPPRPPRCSWRCADRLRRGACSTQHSFVASAVRQLVGGSLQPARVPALGAGRWLLGVSTLNVACVRACSCLLLLWLLLGLGGSGCAVSCRSTDTSKCKPLSYPPGWHLRKQWRRVEVVLI